METIAPPDWLTAMNRMHFPDVPLEHGGGGVVARWRDRELSSVFQPVLSTVDGATIAHSARVRSRVNNADEAPAQVFEFDEPDALVIQLDRSARTLHALNYYPKARATWRLFLRVQARLVESVGRGHGRVFEGILGRLGVPTKDVVIELPRCAQEDPALYARALLSYRSLGYRVASACLGPEDPLLAGYYEVIPDIVAIDIRILSDAPVLAALVQRIRQRGATAFVQCVETSEQAVQAVAAGADLLQGFHLGRPRAKPESPELPPELLRRRMARAMLDD